jgi:hypothetical protein
MRPGEAFLAASSTTPNEDSTMNTASTPSSSPETQLDTGSAAPVRTTRRRPSSEPTSLGTRKTSFMLGEDARRALDELMSLWPFPSKAEAVTHGLLYLAHQSKKGRVSRLPVKE